MPIAWRKGVAMMRRSRPTGGGTPCTATVEPQLDLCAGGGSTCLSPLEVTAARLAAKKTVRRLTPTPAARRLRRFAPGAYPASGRARPLRRGDELARDRAAVHKGRCIQRKVRSL